MAAILVGPYIIDATKCDHEADPPICFCVHDWRITGPVGVPNLDGTSNDQFWGNVEKTGNAESDGQ